MSIIKGYKTYFVGKTKFQNSKCNSIPLLLKMNIDIENTIHGGYIKE